MIKTGLKLAAAALLACAAFVALGQWQSRRAEEKKLLGAEIERARGVAPLEIPAVPVPAASVANKRVSARGEFEPRHLLLLDNKQRHGRVGYEVLMPLRLQGSNTHVLVNRGWIAAPARREDLPQVRIPAGAVRIEGRALERLPRPLYAGRAQGKVRQSIELADFAAETRLRVQPFFLEQHSPLDDGLLREWPRPDAGIDKHRSYALQWYSLAALAAALGLVFSFRRVPGA